MKVYNFLLSKMLTYGNKIAFANSNITYRKLIKIVKEQSKKYKEKGKLIYTTKNEKEKQAIEILSILASKNVCVPITDKYGIKQKQYVVDLIGDDKNTYEDLAFIMFTSGTTSTSKGVMLTDENIINNILGNDNCLNISSEENILIIRPLVHISALVGELLFALYKGLTIHFYEDTLVPRKINQYINENDITMLGSTPTMFNMFLKTKCNLKSLKQAIISGERLSKEIAISLINSYPHINFYNVYGMTENSPRATCLNNNDFNVFIGSVGKPLLNTDIKIIDNEICIKSKSIMKGYYKNKELTNKKIIDGYYHTGDAGYFNEYGYLYVLGRIDNMIIKSGVNIYPEEIENEVRKYENVKDCLVYKITDENDLENIGLKVVGDVSISKLLKHLCLTLPSIMVPSKITIVDKLDKTPSGKLKRWKRLSLILLTIT